MKISIEAEVGKSTRNFFRFALAGALIVGVGSLAVAAAPNTFSAGQTLSAAQLNENFEALDDADGVFVNPNTGKVYSERNGYCGSTAPTRGNLGGLDGAKALCEAACGSPGAHMCSTQEILRDIATGSDIPTGTPWVSSSTSNVSLGGVAFLRDCLRWGNEGGDVGTVIAIYPRDSDNPGGPTPSFGTQQCNTSRPVACCD